MRFCRSQFEAFIGPASDLGGALPENTLLLTDEFRQRYLQEGSSWQSTIRPKVEAFLTSAAAKSRKLRLILDAHASIAFLAGTVLGVKSGVSVELIQKGHVGAKVWRADDGITGLPFEEAISAEGGGRDIAVMMSAAQDVESQARKHIADHHLDVGTIVSFKIQGGPGQMSVAGGAHAAMLADQVANTIRSVKAQDPDAEIHIFASVPNSVLFFLGQQQQAVAPVTIYEFDFDRRGNKSYQPSFIME